jgi:type I restriction enzyme M protein
LQDIEAHLGGGIPDRDLDALDRYWDTIPGVRAALFDSAGRPGYSKLRLPIAEVKSAILDHAEFTRFKESINRLFTKWRKTNTPLLKGFEKDDRPKALIETIAEDLLATFRAAHLVDAYDVYQHLMDYWGETMQDDCYLTSDHCCPAILPGA